MNYKENKKKHGNKIIPMQKTTVSCTKYALHVCDIVCTKGRIQELPIGYMFKHKGIMVQTRTFEMQGSCFHKLEISVSEKYNQVEQIIDLCNLVRALHWTLLRGWEILKIAENIAKDFKPYAE